MIKYKLRNKDGTRKIEYRVFPRWYDINELNEETISEDLWAFIDCTHATIIDSFPVSMNKEERAHRVLYDVTEYQRCHPDMYFVTD